MLIIIFSSVHRIFSCYSFSFKSFNAETYQ